MKYRKKPVIIEARQFAHPVDIGEMAAWCGAEWHYDHARLDRWGKPTQYIVIPTLEGDHRADPGDWIIRGVAGEFYPCKPGIFEQTYEPAGDDGG